MRLLLAFQDILMREWFRCDKGLSQASELQRRRGVRSCCFLDSQSSEANGSSVGCWSLDRVRCVLKGFTEAVRGQKQSVSVLTSEASGVKLVSLAVLT